jgi:hypothetical protein
MELYNATLRPGTVLAVESGGIIKASAPGLFSSEDPIENLPPIYPWFMGNSNQYSQPEVYDEVWILQCSDNPLQLHWFKKDAMEEENEHIGIDEGTDVEVVCNRKNGMGWATIYFTDGTGWVIQNNGSHIDIKKDGSILITTGLPKQSIGVNGRGISLGTEGGSAYSAVLGEPLVDCLNELLSTLGKVGKAAMSNPYTANIGAILTPLPAKMAQSVSGVLSTNVTLD